MHTAGVREQDILIMQMIWLLSHVTRGGVGSLQPEAKACTSKFLPIYLHHDENSWIFNKVTQKKIILETFSYLHATSSNGWYKCTKLRRELIHLIIGHSISNLKHPFFQNYFTLTYKNRYFLTKSKPTLAKNAFIWTMKRSDSFREITKCQVAPRKDCISTHYICVPSQWQPEAIILKVANCHVRLLFYLSSPIKD
jgi:hypothetical protein